MVETRAHLFCVLDIAGKCFYVRFMTSQSLPFLRFHPLVGHFIRWCQIQRTCAPIELLFGEVVDKDQVFHATQ